MDHAAPPVSPQEAARCSHASGRFLCTVPSFQARVTEDGGDLVFGAVRQVQSGVPVHPRFSGATEV